MCGIFGVTHPGGVDVAAVERASRALTHRGPDGFGYVFADGQRAVVVHDRDGAVQGDFSVALASRRLAIIDLETGQQPLSNEDGTVHCVFNGEIYNYRELGDELRRAGHGFKTRSDTEVLCHAYEEWGTRLVDHIEGMFGFALYDSRAGTLSLFRDPLGIKPLYYSLERGRFCFASEIKAILAYDPAVRICRDSVFDFFLFDQIPPPRTPFRDVSRLDAGELLVFDCRASRIASKVKYWDLRFDIRERAAADVVAQTEAVLERVVAKQTVADVPVGTFLSGGIDSSLVTRSLMAHNKTKAIHMHTDDAWSERRWTLHPAFDGVERVDVLYRPLLQDCLDALHTVDDLLRDASILPTFLVSRAARGAGLKVILSGDGGDENFAGYDVLFYPAWLFEKYRRLGLPAWGRQSVLFELFALLAVKPRYRSALRDYVANGTYLPRYADVEITNLICTRKLLPRSVADFRTDAFAEFRYRGEEPRELHLMLYLFYRYYLNVLLAKVDFASMANSVEVRVPHLDREMVELALSLPFALKVRDHGKYPLKAVAAKYFGNEFAHRPKAGFTFDFSPLFQTPEVAEYLRESLRQPGVDEFLDVPGVLGLMERDKRERMQGKRLWRVLMFGEWFKNWGRAHA
jgi:asparagine synthase (glutamine-hydrolysing)